MIVSSTLFPSCKLHFYAWHQVHSVKQSGWKVLVWSPEVYIFYHKQYKVGTTSVGAYKIPKPAKILYTLYVCSLFLCLVDFSCALVSCEIRNLRIRGKYTGMHLIYLGWFSCKCYFHPLSSHHVKYIFIHDINSIQWNNMAGKLWYDLLKSIFSTINMICSLSDHTVFSCYHNSHK